MFPYLLWYDILTVIIMHLWVPNYLKIFFLFIDIDVSTLTFELWRLFEIRGWMSNLDVIVACLSKNEILRFCNKDTECFHLWQNWSWTHHSLIACGCPIFICKAFIKLSTAFTSGRFTFFQSIRQMFPLM